MTLNLIHNSNVQVLFDPRKMKEVDEAKKKYIEARNQNRRIVDLSGEPISVFKGSLGGFVIKEVELSENQFAVRILDETGDRRLIWDSRNPDEIREAKTEFDKYIAKGWKAYAIDRNGKMGKRIRGFDAENEEIIFDETAGIREKLKGFSQKFKEVKMVPRTYPG